MRKLISRVVAEKRAARRSAAQSLQKALSMARALPLSQQEKLLASLRKTAAAKRRAQIIAENKLALREYDAGAVKRGTVEDLLRDLES